MKTTVDANISVLLIIVLACASLLVSSSAFSYTLAWACLTCVIICVLLFIRYQQKSTFNKHWEKPSNIFLLSLLIVYFQWIVDIVIGYKEPSLVSYNNWLNTGMLVSTTGVLSFFVGYVSKNRVSLKSRKSRLKVYSEDSFWLLTILQLVFFVLFLRYVNVSTLISGANYQESASWGDASIYFEYLFYAISYAIIVLRVIKNDNCKSIRQFFRGFPLFSLFVVFVYLALRFMSGDRGPVIDFVLAFFFGYIAKTKARIKSWVMIVFIVLGATVMSLIGIVRTYDTDISFSDKMSNAATMYEEGGRFNEGKTIFKGTEELAGSHLSYLVMIRGGKARGDYNWGRYQFFGFVNSIPFVAGAVLNVFKVPLEVSSSSMYATRSYYGKGKLISGLGSNCIGDFYLDLGIVGVVFFMLLVGALFKYIDSIILMSDLKNISLFSLVFCLIYASRSVYIPRSTFVGDMRFVFMVIIVLWINHMLTTHQKKLNRE